MARMGIIRRTRRIAFLLAAAVAVFACLDAASVQASPPAGSGEWSLRFNDEFSGVGIDPSKWNPAWNGGADGNGTSDISGECPSPEMARQPGDGYLYLAVKPIAITCKYFNPKTQELETISRAARGGVVSSDSKYQFSYGYVEWKVVLPGATKPGYKCPASGCIANWPSFWSRSAGGSTEIDYMDTLYEGKAHWKYHRFYPGPHVEWGETPTSTSGPGQGGGEHTYAARWEPGVVTWYYDNQKVYELPWSQVTSGPHYLLASYLPTRATANWGPPLVPAEAKVDYVKVWQHPKPTVTTDAATEVNRTTAKLNGWVNPNGLPTNYYFEYGKTTSYGNTIPASPGMNLGSGTSSIYTWNNVSGLAPNTTYHFRNVATNASGTSYSVDQTFKTLRTPVGDWDGNGTTDRAVWRPSNSQWFIGLPGYNGGLYGSFDGIPVPGDYDGNGTTDRAVWRPSTGEWQIGLPGFNPSAYGGAADIPVPGDYDGNGTTDRAIWRPSTGEWQIALPGFIPSAYGGAADIPVPGDYDGNGTTDRAIWRPSTGEWQIALPGWTPSAYGGSGDIPVPGDYDGNGTTDRAVWRPSNSQWFIGLPGYNGGLYGSFDGIPVPGDYDGNGTTDRAVWRPSTGEWQIGLAGWTPSAYGGSGDIPAVSTLNRMMLQKLGLR